MTLLPTSWPGSASGAVLSRSVVLTNAQIKALPTTPVEIIPAPAATETILVVAALLAGNFTAAPYLNVTPPGDVATSSLSLVYGNDDGQASTYSDASSLLAIAAVTHVFLGPGNPQVSGTHLAGTDVTCLGENVRLIAYNSLGAYTNGNAANTLTVTVLYGVA